MAVQTEKLRRMFDSDSKLMLETLSRLVSEVPSGEVDPGMVDRAFRAAHSIKSEAGVLELEQIADAAHALENTLAALKTSDGGQPYQGQLKSELIRLTQEIDIYKQTRPRRPADPSASGTKHGASALGLAEQGMLREARGRNESLFRAAIHLTCEPAFYYPRAFLVVNNLEIACSVVQVSPPVDQLTESSDGRFSVLLSTSGNEDLIRKAVSVDEAELVEVVSISYDEIAAIAEPAPPPVYESAGTTLSVDARSQEEILLFADEVAHAAAGMRSRLDSLSLSDDDRDTITKMAEYSNILRSRVDRTARVQLLDVMRSLKPWASTHAGNSGKEARLVVGGSGAVVYSVVADTLADAMLHLVRNSIDHGIEAPSKRSDVGKKPEGIVKIGVERLGDSVRVRVTDDGAGVDEAAIRERTGNHKQALLDILSAPGFTERKEADRSSGRGVGLDSVVHTIRDLLGGKIDIRSQVGRGTIVSITVPVTSRLITVLVVEAADGPAALPASLVVEHRGLNLRRFKRDSFGSRYYDYHGQSLPLLTLFGRNPVDDTLSGDSVGIVVRCGGRNAVLAARRVVATEAVVRDDVQRRLVYSRVLGREIPYLFPPSFAL